MRKMKTGKWIVTRIRWDAWYATAERETPLANCLLHDEKPSKHDSAHAHNYAKLLSGYMSRFVISLHDIRTREQPTVTRNRQIQNTPGLAIQLRACLSVLTCPQYINPNLLQGIVCFSLFRHSGNSPSLCNVLLPSC